MFPHEIRGGWGTEAGIDVLSIDGQDGASGSGCGLFAFRFSLSTFGAKLYPGMRPLAFGSGRYRGVSLIRTPAPEGPYSGPMPRDLW